MTITEGRPDMTDETAILRERVAELEAERDKAQRGAKVLGEMIRNHCNMILDITGLHDWIDEDGDGDWGAVWEVAHELRPERDRLARWKDEALPVIAGLQELGKALSINLGQRITGPQAADAARDLREQLAQAHQMLAAVEALLAGSRGSKSKALRRFRRHLRDALADHGPVLAKRDARVLREAAEPDARERGLEARYYVKKLNDPSGKHDDCGYFALDPKHDLIARAALARYAQVARAEGYGPLADDLDAWLDRLEADS